MTGDDLLDRIKTLTSRETEVLGLLIKGLSNDQIALTLFRSPKTVDKHCQRIFRKLGVNRRVSLVRLCMEAGYHPEQNENGTSGTINQRDNPTTGDDYQVVNELIRKGQAWDRLVNYERLLISSKGPEYFGELVCALCDTFGVRAAGISECIPGDACGVVIAYSVDGVMIPEMTEYVIEGTPCKHAIKEGVFFQQDGLAQSFPDDRFVTDNKYDSYAGVRLDDRILGPIGLVWICDDKPMPAERMFIDVLKMIAPSVAAELGVQIALDQADSQE